MCVCMCSYQITCTESAVKRTPKIDPEELYTPEQAAELLQTSTFKIKPATVKNHCRTGKLKGKQIGLKKIWHIFGSSILGARKQWGLDDSSR